MSHLYRAAALPGDASLHARLDAAASRLWAKLRALDLPRLPISDYNRRYLGEYLANPHSLQPFTYLLAWSLAWSPHPPEATRLLDYGGGCGVFSFLAREAGAGTVIYNDIYGVSCRDARALGEALGRPADHYVVGDAADAVRYVREHGVGCDVVTSNDVIEHVYDIAALFAELPRLGDGPLVQVHASTANPYNPLIRRRLMRLHREVEERDRPAAWGQKERDTRRAYLSVRRELIAEHAPELGGEAIDRLARATRGLMDRDIRAYVDEYRRAGTIGRAPEHPTNTCDPRTGNWAEHLMDLERLSRETASQGFETRLVPGYYGSGWDSPKGLVGAALNTLIRLSGNRLALAPYFVLVARRGAATSAPRAEPPLPSPPGAASVPAPTR